MEKNLFEVLKGLFWGLIVCGLITLLSSCKSVRYVTVPEVHTEYINKTDSILVRDTLISEKQTIIKELDSLAIAEFGIALKGQKKAYLVQINDLKRQVNSQKEVIRDTVIRRDSIPYPVVHEVIKKEKDKTGWIIAIILSCVFFVIIKRKLG